MELSKIRQTIVFKNRERSKLLHKAMRTKKKMIRGSLYQMKRVCGNPNCKCVKGSKHVSWYLSQGIRGKTKLTYIGREVPLQVSYRVEYYQERQRLLSQIRKIDHEISLILNQIRDEITQSISEVSDKK